MERASSPLTPEPEVPDMKLQMKGKKETVIEKRPSEPVLSPKLRKATKHDDHWYLDGSIIIYVEGTLSVFIDPP